MSTDRDRVAQLRSLRNDANQLSGYHVIQADRAKTDAEEIEHLELAHRYRTLAGRCNYWIGNITSKYAPGERF